MKGMKIMKEETEKISLFNLHVLHGENLNL